jgi:hypothetical protein
MEALHPFKHLQRLAVLEHLELNMAVMAVLAAAV